MKRLVVFASLAAVLGLAAALALAQQSWTLPEVLTALTKAAPGIHSVQANAAVTDYTALVQEAAHSSGKLYFERSARGPQYALDLTKPADTAKKLIYTDQTAYVYTPSAHQLIKYDLGAHPQELNQYLLLGMGATGEELTHSFHVTLDGQATLGGQTTVKLTLTPLSPKAADKITHIDIWYSTRTWIGVQQQIWQPGGDYHLLTLSDAKLNPKLSDEQFSTRFPGATVVTPQF